MSNVLNEEKKQQVVALGRLGWSLRRIEEATGVRRETASGYVQAAGIALRPPGGWGRAFAKVAAGAKPAKGVATGSEGEKPRDLPSEARASPTEPESARGCDNEHLRAVS